jgi:hypothetical protein
MKQRPGFGDYVSASIAKPCPLGATVRPILTILFSLYFNAVFPQRFDFGGRIVSLKTNKPLPNVIVTVSKTNHTVQSDLNGYFVFRGYPSGKYVIVLSSLGATARQITVDVQQTDDTARVFIFQDTCMYDVKGKNKNCPVCHKRNRVIPIVYGLPIGELDEFNYYYAGCEVSDCDPKWFCKRDNTKF